jgi:hypothetical protein
MKLLTGKDRVEYECLSRSLASYAVSVDSLQARIEEGKLREQSLASDITRERQRADNAIDALLALRGIPPVTPQPPQAYTEQDPLREDPEAVARIEQLIADHGLGAVVTER